MALIRTKRNYDYSTFDDRALTHDGCIVDVGCAGWDMFASIAGKKRIIGVDPFEEHHPDYELFKGVLSPVMGEVAISNDADESSLNAPVLTKKVKSLPWKGFCLIYEVKSVSILKLNIEGAEYPLLHSMGSDDFEKIDQIMVSFHDWINPKWKNLTDASIYLLQANGFDMVHKASQYGWHLFVKR